MKSLSRLLPLALAAGLMSTLSACKPTTTVAAVTGVAARPELPILKPGPAWKLQDLDGREVSAASLKGKVVVVDFWATWCGPCIQEIPGYIALQKKYGKDGLVIVGVSEDQKGPEQVKKFAEKNGMNYVIAMDDGKISEAFGGLEAIPTTFLLDRAGNIRHSKVGALPHDEYEKLVQSLLQ